jgi:hypothetical protein
MVFIPHRKHIGASTPCYGHSFAFYASIIPHSLVRLLAKRKGNLTATRVFEDTARQECEERICVSSWRGFAAS